MYAGFSIIFDYKELLIKESPVCLTSPLRTFSAAPIAVDLSPQPGAVNAVTKQTSEIGVSQTQFV